MTEEYRADSFDVTIADKVGANEYLHIKGSITGVGIFKYKQLNGSTLREFRPSEEVFRADSMDTLKSVPIVSVLDHVKTALGIEGSYNDGKNMRIVGSVGEKITKNANDCLDASLTIYDKDIIKQAINNPNLQLTAGYKLNLELTPGVYKGKAYDAIQRDIVYGHVTLVNKGRAGSRCQIRADSAENEDSKKEKDMSKRKIPELVIGTFRADALEIEETQDTLNLLAQRVRLGVELTKTRQRADTTESEKAALTKLNKDLQTKLDGAIPQTQYRADLQESLELLKMAEELGLKIKDDFTPKALKLAICSKIDPEMKNRADMSDGYLDGAFGQIKTNFAQKISELKTLSGLDFAKDHGQTQGIYSQMVVPVSETEYEDHGNIE